MLRLLNIHVSWRDLYDFCNAVFCLCQVVRSCAKIAIEQVCGSQSLHVQNDYVPSVPPGVFLLKNVGSAPKCTLSQVDCEEDRPLLECPANIGYHVIQMCKFQCMRCHVAGQTKLIHMCGISGDNPGIVASPTVGWLQHCPRTRPSLLGQCVPMFPLGRLILFIVSASILTGIGFEGLACVRDFMSCSEVIMAVFGAWQDGWKCVARGHE